MCGLDYCCVVSLQTEKVLVSVFSGHFDNNHTEWTVYFHCIGSLIMVLKYVWRNCTHITYIDTCVTVAVQLTRGEICSYKILNLPDTLFMFDVTVNYLFGDFLMSGPGATLRQPLERSHPQYSPWDEPSGLLPSFSGGGSQHTSR